MDERLLLFDRTALQGTRDGFTLVGIHPTIAKLKMAIR